MSLSWHGRALVVIAERIETGRRLGMTVEQIRAAVDAAYPFGQREYHPYKQWLKARREMFSRFGLRTDAEIAKERAHVPRDPSAASVDRTWEAAKRDGLIL